MTENKKKEKLASDQTEYRKWLFAFSTPQFTVAVRAVWSHTFRNIQGRLYVISRTEKYEVITLIEIFCDLVK